MISVLYTEGLDLVIDKDREVYLSPLNHVDSTENMNNYTMEEYTLAQHLKCHVYATV